MKEKESQVTNQKEQSTTTQQARTSKPLKNGVFMMRGKGQSWEEFVRICIQSLKDAGLIKAKSTTPFEEPPDKYDLQASELIEKGLEKYKDKYVSNPESTTPFEEPPDKRKVF